MACCRRNRIRYPIARLCAGRDENGDIIQINNCSIWYDLNCNESLREVEWYFYLDGQLIYSIPFQKIGEIISIGNNSSSYGLVLSNGSQDVFDFLENLGFTIEAGQKIGIQIQIKNCLDIQSFSPSNIIEIIKPSPCFFPWLTLEGQHFETLSENCWEHYNSALP
ncbi:MAG: hypothetical protein NXI23_14515 [Bacteroidetes bacterium]|jgi:hypothetical protein|nr:hypothetical protein [Bacteroidota bacterium]MDF1863627.1 hypothetical protein [Saprospiraceae bacterium]